MVTSSQIQNKKDKRIFVNNNFTVEFNSILSFISEMCEITGVYLNIKDIDDENKFSDYKIGIDATISDSLPTLIDLVVRKNKTNGATTIDKVSQIKLESLNNSASPLIYFAGFPIINAQEQIIGSLSIMDLSPKTLSTLQSKIISQSITNIQFLINLEIENNELKNNFIEREALFDSHYENSIEIVYELDENGIITDLSKNWKTILGHEKNAVVGTNFIYFIHPEDEHACMHAVRNLTERKTFKEAVTYRIRHKDDSYVWHNASLKIVKKKRILFYWTLQGHN